MKVNKIAFAVGTAALVAAAWLGADAQTTSPINVVSVVVFNSTYGDVGKVPGAVLIQFENNGTKTAKTVVFELHEKLRQHGTGQYNDIMLGRIRDVGTFTPGIVISKAHANRWSDLSPIHRHTVSLVPIEVDFADGTTWTAGTQ